MSEKDSDDDHHYYNIGNYTSKSDEPSAWGQSDCFVATACFEDRQHPAVERLRHFRDQKLTKSVVGRAFIAAYNEVGPRAAKVVARHPGVKPVLRRVLTAISNRIAPNV